MAATKIRELAKRGLAIDPDGEGFVISAVGIEPPDDVIHHKPTYEEAYAWALQMPCILSDEKLDKAYKQIDRSRQVEEILM